MLAGHSSSTSSPAADVNSTSIGLAKRAAFAANLSAAFQTTVLAAATGAARNISAARGLLPDPSRACLVPPPAGCNGNGVQNLTACTCNCNSGYSNDLSNIVAPQWCIATNNNPDGRPGISPTPAPANGVTPVINTGTGGGGFTKTRMFWILLVGLLLLVSGCIIWCYIRIRRRRARQQKKKRKRRARKSSRRSTDSTSSSSSGSSSSSAASDAASAKAARSKGSGSSKQQGRRSSVKAHKGRSSKAQPDHLQRQHSNSSHGSKRPKLSSPPEVGRLALWPPGDEEEAGYSQRALGRQHSGSSNGSRAHRHLSTSPGAFRDGRTPQKGKTTAAAAAAAVASGGDMSDEEYGRGFDLQQVQVMVDATGYPAYEPELDPPWGGRASPYHQQQQHQQHSRQGQRNPGVPRLSAPTAAAAGSGAYHMSSGGGRRGHSSAGTSPGPGPVGPSAAAILAAQRARLAASAPGGRAPAGLSPSPSPQQQRRMQQRQQPWQQQQEGGEEEEGWVEQHHGRSGRVPGRGVHGRGQRLEGYFGSDGDS